VTQTFDLAYTTDEVNVLSFASKNIEGLNSGTLGAGVSKWRKKKKNNNNNASFIAVSERCLSHRMGLV